MLRKTPYEKPQSEIVWLSAPTVLVSASGFSEGTPGSWTTFEPFDFPLGGAMTPEKFQDLL